MSSEAEVRQEKLAFERMSPLRATRGSRQFRPAHPLKKKLNNLKCRLLYTANVIRVQVLQFVSMNFNSNRYIYFYFIILRCLE